ncbi:MAG: TonB family protein [Candidatus Competibacteraceae bacterium]|nr:TonB family protein [Candidatus Competibacteraceae bacterium]
MSSITHKPDDTGRLALALLLALSLHAALIFGIPADSWSIHYRRPPRFEVVLLPPTILPALPPPPLAAVIPLEPAPAVVPPLALPPKPAVTVKPARPIARQSTGVTKSTPTATAPIERQPTTIPKPSLRTPLKPFIPPKPAKASEKGMEAPSNPVPAKPRRDSAPSEKTATSVSSKPTPAVSGMASAPPIPQAERFERIPSIPGTRQGQLDSGGLLGQIASLERETQQRANTRVRSKRVSPNDTRSQEGFYIAAWVRKVEQIGEMNFPEVARQLNLRSGPVLDVAIRADGSLQEVRVARSSGNAELDRAAQRIVKLGAPYATFPPSLRQKYDVLYISRPWRFEPDGRLQMR